MPLSWQIQVQTGNIGVMTADIPKEQADLDALVTDLLSIRSLLAGGAVGLGVDVWGSRYQINESDGVAEIHLIGKSMKPEATLNQKSLKEDPVYLANLTMYPEQKRAIEEFRRDFPEVKKAFEQKAKRLASQGGAVQP